MPNPDAPPTPDQFRGQPLRSYLDALVSWARRDRIDVDEGAGINSARSPQGRRLQLGNLIGMSIVKTTSSVTARSSTTPGTGPAVLVNGTTTTLTNGSAITVYNIAGAIIPSGKYGFAVRIGLWWMVAWEC